MVRADQSLNYSTSTKSHLTHKIAKFISENFTVKMLCPIFPRLELIITTVIMICQDSSVAKQNLNGSLKNLL